MFKRSFPIILSLFIFSACVPNRKLTYLQKDETGSKTDYTLNREKYKVQPNDILNITVRSLDQEAAQIFNAVSNENLARGGASGELASYLNGYSVDLEGFIEMPVLGKVNVSGLNVDEIKRLVEKRLNLYFKENTVYINVQLAGVRYSVIGEVNNPGKYVIYQNQVNIFEALAQAGDITIVGDRNEVQIVRQLPAGVKIISVNLLNEDILSSEYFFIQPNDIINVKPLPQKSIGVGTTGFSTLASVLSVVSTTLIIILSIQNFKN